MVDESRGSILISRYTNQNASRLNNDIHIIGNTTSFDPLPKSDVQRNVWSIQSMRMNKSVNQSSESSDQLKIDAWVQGEQSNMKLQKESSSAREKTKSFKRFFAGICSPRYIACFLGFIIGSLFAGIALAVVSTVWLGSASTSTSTTPSSSETITTSITSTTTTTTIHASAVAYSSLTSYCGCSGFTLSLSNISFVVANTTYQWQSSPVGQNIWSNINTSSSSSSLSIASQGNSADYKCQIIVLYPIPMNLTSTIVTVITTTNTTYCQTRLDNCNSFGDDINNFILIGELGTQIIDLATNCSVNSYDNRTQESVSLYENMNYTAQASTQFTSNEKLAIWIDFNNNFQFESSEQVAYQPLNSNYNTNVTVAIPSSSSGATTGVHRMRVTLAFSNIPNPCGTSSTYGETHDYTVNILSPVG